MIATVRYYPCEGKEVFYCSIPVGAVLFEAIMSVTLDKIVFIVYQDGNSLASWDNDEVVQLSQNQGVFPELILDEFRTHTPEIFGSFRPEDGGEAQIELSDVFSRFLEIAAGEMHEQSAD